MSLARASTGLTALDHVLGGGLAAASVVLIASPPCIGTSELTLQMLAGLGHRSLYVTGEETREHVEGTARRIGVLTPQLSVISERNLATIFAHAREVRAQTIVVDSIQVMICEDVTGRRGSLTQVKECVARLVHYAKTNDTALWLIGHVTSAGDIAGPKTIEHDVDVVLTMDKGPRFEGRERILRCPSKNRFGPTCVAGHFELTAKGFVPVEKETLRTYCVETTRTSTRAFAEGLRWLDRYREVADSPLPNGVLPPSGDDVYALAYAKGYHAAQDAILARFVGCENLSTDEIWRRLTEAIEWSNEAVDRPVRPDSPERVGAP